MAVRGSRAKEQITKKILETFEGSFQHEKEIRIPYTEDGVAGQIKVTLTAAKVMIENNDNNFPAVEPTTPSSVDNTTPEIAKPTEEEKERLKTLLERLGL